jgi:PAS domain S-box-containing protein
MLTKLKIPLIISSTILSLLAIIYLIAFSHQNFRERLLLNTLIVLVLIFSYLVLYRNYKDIFEARLKADYWEEKARQEEELRCVQNHLETILNNSLDLICSVKRDGTFSYINPQLEKMTGYSQEQIRGKKFADIVQEHQKPLIIKKWKEIDDTSLSKVYETQIIKADGSFMYCLVSHSYLKEYDEFLLSIKDISERKRLQERIATINELSRKLITLLDEKQIIQAFLEITQRVLNFEFCDFLMVDEENRQLIVTDSLDRSPDILGKRIPLNGNKGITVAVAQSGEAINVPDVCKDSRHIPARFREGSELCVPVKIKDKIIGVINAEKKETNGFSVNDHLLLTELASQAALAIENTSLNKSILESEQKYRSVVDNIGIGISMISPDLEILSLNNQMKKWFPDIDISRKPHCYHSLNHSPLESICPKCPTYQTLKDGFIHESATEMRKGDQDIDYRIVSYPIKINDGEIIAAIEMVEDITERKRAEKELIEARKAALLASRTKSEFLASMSHEIRTPMNAIIGMADLLWETSLSSEQQQYVKVFKSAGENLLEIINDILDISKAETGHIELENIDFDLNEQIEKTIETFAVRAHEKDLELSYHIMPDVPIFLTGDPIRLRQVLSNLIGNAIKFTEKGEVTLAIKKNETPGCLLFSVSDTGMGIPKEKVNIIFDSFTQADSSTTRTHGGTGLGLAICKRLVELMEGHIWVESQVNGGSTFHFEVYFGIQTEPRVKKLLPEFDLKDLRTLVVDDNATNRLILKEHLSTYGASVQEVENGMQAISELKEAKKSGHPFKLVLMDSLMPGMGGFEAVKHIKEDPNLDNLTIMMLTSTTRKGDAKKCQDLDIASYMVKPIKKSELLDAIRSALGKAMRNAKQQRDTFSETPGDQRPLKILFVEDSQDNRFLIQAFLKKTPYRLSIAENGQIALEKFQSDHFNIVLMDMQMPVMDGFTATRKIRELEIERGLIPTPIIALTAYALQEEVQKSLDAGCTLHLSKPIKKEKLLETIVKYSRSN